VTAIPVWLSDVVPANKCHWCHDEKVLLTCEEICLSGTSRNLNLDLSLVFPDRTFEVVSQLAV